MGVYYLMGAFSLLLSRENITLLKRSSVSSVGLCCREVSEVMGGLRDAEGT